MLLLVFAPRGIGGPVTHLYENLTGNDWKAHGTSKYCCYSVYRKLLDDDGDEGSPSVWEPLVVNKTVDVANDSEERLQQQTGKSTDEAGAFAWA